MLPLQDKSRPGFNGNKEVLHIPQIHKVGVSSSNGLMSYPGHSLGVSYSSAEMQSEYSTAPADWVAMESEYHWYIPLNS